MIAVLKPGASPERTQHLIHWLEEQNLGVHVSQGEYQTVLGLIGNTAKVDMEMIQSLDIVESVTRVSDPSRRSTGSSTRRTLSFRRGPRPSAGAILPSSPAPARWRRRSRSPMWPSRSKGRGPPSCGGRVQAPDLAL